MATPFPIWLGMLMARLSGNAFNPLLGEGADNFGGDMEEEYRCDEGE